MIVMKIGGSSLKNTESLNQVIEIIANNKTIPKVVVLSAVYGVTNHLFKSVNEALETEKNINGLLEYLELLHRELISECIKSVNLKRRVMDETDYLLSRLEKLLFGIAYTGECTPRTKDLIVSYGERFSVNLVAGCLRDKGLQAIPLEADKIDLVATGNFGYGNAQLEETEKLLPQNLTNFIERGTIPVITGFFGRTPEGKTITFGRGGTDYSAAIIANVLNCDELQIWKDVDGFLTANPDIVKSAQPLEYLSYEEAAELAYFGASILHPRTVEPLSKKKILAVVKNTFKPHLKGTIIGPDQHLHEDVIKSVTVNREIGALRIFGASIGQQLGFLKMVSSTLSDSRINVTSIITSQTAISLILSIQELSKAKDAIQALNISYIDDLQLVTDIALIGVVGHGLSETKGVASRVFSAVARTGTNVEMISSGASTIAQYFIVKESDVDDAIKSIHDEFINPT
jgi:aspartate kinase